MKYKVFILIISVLFVVSAQSQSLSTTNKKAIKLYENAMETLYRGETAAAETKLEAAVREAPEFLEARLVLADLLLDEADRQARQDGDPHSPSATQYRTQAKQHYRTVVDTRSDLFVPAWASLGKIELFDGDYDEAIRCLEKFATLYHKEDKTALDAQHSLAAARFRKNAVANPVPFNPVNLGAGVNSADDEYLPSLTADGQTLVFTRRFPRKASTTASTKNEEDLYTSTLQNGQWGKATRIPEPLNSNDNEGAQCLSQDGRIMFFTACNRSDGGGRCDIYMCVNKNNKWGKPRNIGSPVNSGAWEGQPTFSIDGRTLYFVSNRKGGYGGMDLWKTTFEQGRWSEPVNLGPQINTEWDEMSPFIHFDDQTLYFASNRPEGMGGHDIFMARKDADGNWQSPRNLGYPINTDGDDNNLVVSADGATAIFASSRSDGYGKMDLYSFELPAPLRPAEAVCFKGTVADAKTGQKIAADIKVVDIRRGTVVANTTSDAASGEYIVSLPTGTAYAFTATAKGYLFHSQNQPETQGGKESWQPVTVDILLQPIEAGGRIALRNVFFETGRYELLPESEYELSKVVELLQQNPTLRIELGGHTDNVGKPEANKQLSEQRAKAVLDYLAGKGIDTARLTHKGYGESQPVADNSTPEGRAANRRTEIRIL